MGRKSKKRKASGRGPTGVAKAQADKAEPVPNKKPIPAVTPKNGEVAIKLFQEAILCMQLRTPD